MTLGVFLSSLSALLLRKFDSKMQSVTTDPNSFGKVIPNIMFLGMMATLSAPYLADVTNIPCVAERRRQCLWRTVEAEPWQT